MYRFIAIWRSETIYFSEHIKNNIRRVFASNIFKSLSTPLMTTFLNAFVFRATGTLLGVAAYNIGYFMCLPIAFYINGFLLRRVHIRLLLAWGVILGGVAGAAFVVAGPPNTFVVFIYGCAWGVGNGFYWANRNYLEFQETLADMRQYFYGFLSSIGSIANIIVPFIAGWFIVLGAHFHLYSARHAYWMIFGLAFILLFISGTIIRHGTFESPAPELISRLRTGPFWKRRRLLSFASGFTDGTMSFTPVLLLLLFVGNEGVLGSVTALVSFVTAIAMYLYGRYVKTEYRYEVIFISSSLFFVSTLFLLFFPAKMSIILHMLLVGVSTSFFAMAVSPILLSLAEEEMGENKESRYSFIFDDELFLDSGRLVGIGVVLGIACLTSQTTALIYGSVVVAGIHLVLISIFLLTRKD